MINTHIVDAPCGFGKTSGAIKLMNDSDPSKKYMFITPFLREVERVRNKCTNRKFYEPQEVCTKTQGIIKLLRSGHDIASTHSLFKNFGEEIENLIKCQDYTLVLDEVTDVVEKYEVSKKDFQVIIEKFADIKDNMLVWREEQLDYNGVFNNIKEAALSGCVGVYGDTMLIWCFPISVFRSFKEVYVLTYMFDAQIQRYYYDLYDVQYDHKYVKKVGEDYYFTDEKQVYDISWIKNAINICEDDKLNNLGDRDTALSVGWYSNNGTKIVYDNIKNNMYNYFRHITKTSSEFNMWTCFKKNKSNLRGGGYSKGFVVINARATNDFRHKTALAYMCNKYIDPIIKGFFKDEKNISVDEERYALSELVQWMWRSAIRDGKPINIYIPSRRMRTILKNWIDEEWTKINN